jgi:hypothetical protein
MKINEDLNKTFKDVFKRDYNLILDDNEIKEATANLVNFFDLLLKFYNEDKEKIKVMEIKKYET